MITQRQRLKNLFESRPNEWIPLPDILRMNIAQYGARIKELRDEGMNIENTSRFVEGARHSWFRYVVFKESVQGQLQFA